MKDTGDWRPADVEYTSVYKVAVNSTAGGVSEAATERVADEAFEAVRGGGRWKGPDGEEYVAVFAPHDLRRGCADPMIVGYKKLRAADWYVALDGEIVLGPARTKRGCLAHIRAKRGKIVAAGWYTAKGHDVFIRGMAEAVLGRRLTEGER